MSRASTAARIREEKAEHPERFCSARGCLWRTSREPCRKHEARPSQAPWDGERAEVGAAPAELEEPGDDFTALLARSIEMVQQRREGPPVA